MSAFVNASRLGLRVDRPGGRAQCNQAAGLRKIREVPAEKYPVRMDTEWLTFMRPAFRGSLTPGRDTAPSSAPCVCAVHEGQLPRPRAALRRVPMHRRSEVSVKWLQGDDMERAPVTGRVAVPRARIVCVCSQGAHGCRAGCSVYSLGL